MSSDNQYAAEVQYLDCDREIEIGYTYTAGYPMRPPTMTDPGEPGAAPEIEIYAVAVIDDQGKRVNLTFWPQDFESGLYEELCECAESV